MVLTKTISILNIYFKYMFEQWITNYVQREAKTQLPLYRSKKKTNKRRWWSPVKRRVRGACSGRRMAIVWTWIRLVVSVLCAYAQPLWHTTTLYKAHISLYAFGTERILTLNYHRPTAMCLCMFWFMIVHIYVDSKEAEVHLYGIYECAWWCGMGQQRRDKQNHLCIGGMALRVYLCDTQLIPLLGLCATTDRRYPMLLVMLCSAIYVCVLGPCDHRRMRCPRSRMWWIYEKHTEILRQARMGQLRGTLVTLAWRKHTRLPTVYAL